MKNLLIFVIESIISKDVQNPVSKFEGPLYIESTVNCRIEFWKSDSGLLNQHKPEKIELYNFRGIHPDGTKARDLSLSKMIQFLIINRNLIGAIKMEFEDKILAAKIYMAIESEAKKNQIIIGNDIYIKRPNKKENPTSRRVFEMLEDLDPYGLRKKDKELNVNIIEEFILIVNKQSKLSRSDRDRVIKSFHKEFMLLEK